jgi:hypothetical protein
MLHVGYDGQGSVMGFVFFGDFGRDFFLAIDEA